MAALSLSLAYALPSDPLRVLAFTLMGLAFSSVSVVVYYRRLEFLAAEAVHASLLAVTAGVVLEHYTGLTYIAYAVVLGLGLVYSTALMIERGLSQDKATAVVVSLSSALSVLVIHYALTNIPLKYSLTGLVLGDPLLLTREDAIVVSAVSACISALLLLSSGEIVETSIDPVLASILGVNTRLYSFLAYTAIGVSATVLLKAAGYVMEHVFILLPAIVASTYSEGVRAHFADTVLLGTSLASVGYALSLALNTAPTGITGVMLFLLLLIGYAWRRSK